MRPVALVLTAGTLLFVSACGGDDEKKTREPSSAATGSSVETVDVSETEFKLDPANPRIDRAGLVEFNVKNGGGTVHALEVEGPSGEAKTSDIQPGESASLKVDLNKPGSYEWYCPIGNHRDQGMEGEITVAGGAQSGGGSTTGTTETQTTETNTTETNTTETDDSGGSGSNSGSGGSGGGY